MQRAAPGRGGPGATVAQLRPVGSGRRRQRAPSGPGVVPVKVPPAIWRALHCRGGCMCTHRRWVWELRSGSPWVRLSDGGPLGPPPCLVLAGPGRRRRSLPFPWGLGAFPTALSPAPCNGDGGGPGLVVGLCSVGRLLVGPEGGKGCGSGGACWGGCAPLGPMGPQRAGA